jgi:hypothetical protein
MRPILRKRDPGVSEDTLVIAPVPASDSPLAATGLPGIPATSSSGLPSLDPAGQPPASAAPAVANPAAASPPAAVDGELAAHRDRLSERFAIMQCELGGLFYEMAIRDHIRMDVLIERAAALQRVDAELGQIERMLETGSSTAGGACPSCGAIYARGAAFCALCAHPLAVA